MKFGKHLARAMEVSDPEWHPFWVNYKLLKRLLKPTSDDTSEDTALPAVTAVSAKPTAATRPAPSGQNGLKVPPDAGQGESEGTINNVAGESPKLLDRRESHEDREKAVLPHLSGRESRKTTAGTKKEASPASASPPAAASPSESDFGIAQYSIGCRSDQQHVGGSSAAAPATTVGTRQEKKVYSHRHDQMPQQKQQYSAKNPSARGALTSLSEAAAGATINSAKSPSMAWKHKWSFSCSMAVADGVRGIGRCCGGRAKNGLELSPGQLRPEPANTSTTTESGSTADAVDQRRSQQQPYECPFFSALLREVEKCRIFFLENEEELKVRTKRLQTALDYMTRPDLSRLSTVKGAHTKLMKACVGFYRDALLLEDFAMLNFTAVIKLLKKRDKISGTSDKRRFMEEVMADQPFAMYPGVVKRVAQVEQIFRDIEDMCFVRTGEGMKSVLKEELTVVEAILQLTQESQHAQQEVLHDEALDNPSPPRNSAASNHQQREQTTLAHLPLGSMIPCSLTSSTRSDGRGSQYGRRSSGSSPEGEVVSVHSGARGDALGAKGGAEVAQRAGAVLQEAETGAPGTGRAKEAEGSRSVLRSTVASTRTSAVKAETAVTGGVSSTAVSGGGETNGQFGSTDGPTGRNIACHQEGRTRKRWVVATRTSSGSPCGGLARVSARPSSSSSMAAMIAGSHKDRARTESAWVLPKHSGTRGPSKAGVGSATARDCLYRLGDRARGGAGGRGSGRGEEPRKKTDEMLPMEQERQSGGSVGQATPQSSSNQVPFPPPTPPCHHLDDAGSSSSGGGGGSRNGGVSAPTSVAVNTLGRCTDAADSTTGGIGVGGDVNRRRGEVDPPLLLGPRLATSAGLFVRAGGVPKQARLG